MMQRWCYTNTHKYVPPEQRDAASSTEVRFSLFAVVAAIVCFSRVLFIRCHSFRSTFILDTWSFSPPFLHDTRSFSPSSSTFCCIFVSFPSAASCPHFPCVSLQSLAFRHGHHLSFSIPSFCRYYRYIIFLILNQPSASRQIRAWNAPEAVAYITNTRRVGCGVQNLLQCRTRSLPHYTGYNTWTPACGPALYCHVLYFEVSQKRRGHLGFRAENMCNFGCSLVITLF